MGGSGKLGLVKRIKGQESVINIGMNKHEAFMIKTNCAADWLIGSLTHTLPPSLSSSLLRSFLPSYPPSLLPSYPLSYPPSHHLTLPPSYPLTLPPSPLTHSPGIT